MQIEVMSKLNDIEAFEEKICFDFGVTTWWLLISPG